jgi:SAM-dependent methyltransferase
MSGGGTAEPHFAFGENWRSFARGIDEPQIVRSDEGVRRLFPDGELTGARVLDIGCGSGLPALSILRAGAAHVTCVDIDPASVQAARQTLGRFAPPEVWSAQTASVFDLQGSFDVVYSWGVLHHTGDMWRAIEAAARLVAPGGLFCIAIYTRGPLCGLWRVEKRYYSRASPAVQRRMRRAYSGLIAMSLAVRGRSMAGMVRAYDERGMDWEHDIHDWMGGYPYESATVEEMQAFVAKRGFKVRRLFPSRAGLGSGCSEYVFERS